MYSNFLIIIGILVLAITGFMFLAVTLLAVSESLERKPPSLLQNFLSSHRLRFPLPHGECYEQCMTESDWDPKNVADCSSACGM